MSLRSLAQTGIIDETTCLEPVAPLAQTGFFPLGMVQLMSRQGGQGGPRNDQKRDFQRSQLRAVKSFIEIHIL